VAKAVLPVGFPAGFGIDGVAGLLVKPAPERASTAIAVRAIMDKRCMDKSLI